VGAQRRRGGHGAVRGCGFGRAVTGGGHCHALLSGHTWRASGGADRRQSGATR
jgi:hypothetical protein